MQASADLSTKSAQSLAIGNVIVIVELEGKADLVATKKGDLDASFNMKAYEAEIKKGLGPLEAGFKVGVTGTPSGSLAVKVFGVKVAGITFSGTLKLIEGAAELQFSKPVTMMSKGIKYTGTITMTAKFRIFPNLRMKPKSVRRPDFELEVGAKEVAVVVVVVVVVVAGGWVVAAGASAVEGAAALGAMALAAFLAVAS